MVINAENFFKPAASVCKTLFTFVFKTMKAAVRLLFLFALFALSPFENLAQENPGDVEGVTMLTLTPEEFLKLGVKVEDKRLFFYKEKPIEQMSFTIGREFTIPKEDLDAGKPGFTARFNVTTNGISIAEGSGKNQIQMLNTAPAHPLVITSYRNGKLLAMHWESKDSAMMKFVHKNADSFSKAKSLNSLLPLHTVLKDPKSKNFKEVDVILWYENKQELLDLIPQRFNSRTIVVNEVVDGKDNEVERISFLRNYDTWREQAGVIVKTHVYPNPIRDRKATIAFSVSEERVVTITLHDVFGRKLLDLVYPQLTPKGVYQRDIVLKDIAKGMYLISVQTDRGEQAVQRILVD
jgi:hypothetical protein